MNGLYNYHLSLLVEYEVCLSFLELLSRYITIQYYVLVRMMQRYLSN